MENKNKTTSILVQIAAVICIFTVAIVAIFAIFAKEQMLIAAYIVGALCVMGLGMSYFCTLFHSGRPGKLPPAEKTANDSDTTAATDR